jgi:demethylmenaquinone methyltransferase/2-methoxy-6-polyprenyl-1,4-benzoquinol methylase
VPDVTNAANEHAGRVREMFSGIAKRYDFLNHLLSGNVDKRWRRIVATRVREKLSSSNARILDVACGTGDLSLTLFENTGARVIGADFCRPMLEIAATKIPNELPLIEGDALQLPFRDGAFEVVTIAFGLRNLSSVEGGLAELRRVEFARPANAMLRPLFGMYFTKVLPLMGGLISGKRTAYSYLPASVQKFPDQQELSLLMQRAGFDQVQFENLTGGIAALHMGRRAG